jgi:L-amino acid N-acyltransferase YncA
MNIRSIHSNDTEAVLSIYAPYILQTAATFETAVPSQQEFSERIAQYTAKYPWLVAEEEGKVVGYAYAGKHRDRDAYQWCAESSVYVEKAYQGKGVARKLYEQLFQLLREDGYVNIYAGITQPNEPSNRLHQHMGFEPVGTYQKVGYKLGRWHDVLWMVKTLIDHPSEPAPPKKHQAFL